MLGLQRIIAPADEPITLDQAKQHLRVTTSDDDAYIQDLISAAREKVEIDARRQLMAATWRLTLDYFPGRHWLHSAPLWSQERAWEQGRWFSGRSILLPRPPILAVSSITYIDTAGAQQTWDPSQYLVDTAGEPGRVHPAYNVDYPSTRQQLDAIQITYTAGYAAASATISDQQAAVAPTLRHMVKLLLGAWYDNRNAIALGNVNIIPMAYESLLQCIRVPWVF